jgi:disulfide bond formation protein DsbB
MSFLSFSNTFLALLTIVSQIALAVEVGYLATASREKRRQHYQFIARYFLWAGIIISVGSFLGSIYYSNIIGFEPCSLCWWERMFIYPQIIIFAVAIAKRDRGVADYILPLSVIGALFSWYHTYLSLGGTPIITCGTEGVSCAKRYVFEFGYVTIPVMVLTAFLLLTFLAAATRASRRQS